ncbi:MAG: TrmH family RNA methyltransferase [Candidatus Cryptobacteroides sp.]|nr:RNA methyltransferase [Bacteroidales bacterium]
MLQSITSAQNPKIKDFLALQEKSRLRREKGLFVVEGRRELLHCLEAGFSPRTIFVCEEILGAGEMEAVLGAAGEGCTVFSVSANVYDRMAYRSGTEGVTAIMQARNLRLEELRFRNEEPLIVVVEAVEKPGNLGAILRSADAAGADAVIVCDPLTDLYNPNLIRASIGAVFSVPVVAASSAETIEWLRSRGVTIYTAQLQDSSWYYDCDMKKATAIVMGTEATGLTGIWREAADRHIRIPMLGKLDSLNVSVSAAVLLFEAVRQRNSK